MEKPIVSVIIPVYNKREYIRQTIDSVLGQEFDKFELIVIDDGSTDSSLQIVNEFNDSRMRVFSQVNAGVERARNFGFSKSVGPFVVFLDADDLMGSNRLRKQIDLFNATNDLVLAGTWASVIDKFGNTTGAIRPPTSNTALQLAHLFRNQFVSSSVMIKRSAIENDVVFNETRGKRFAEDFDLWLRISKKGRVANIPETLTTYRRLNASRSQSSDSSLLESARDISAEWLYRNTNRFESIGSAHSFVMSVNGLDDLSPNSGCDIKHILKTYDLVLDELQLGKLGEGSVEYRKVSKHHKAHIVTWSLLGYVPLPIQRKVFSFFGSFKSLKFARWLLKTLANSNS